MKRFVFTTPSFEGEIVFEYGLNGLLTSFQIAAALSDDQHKWILGHLPVNSKELEGLRVVKNCKLTEVKVEITFAMFYTKYPIKRNKIRAMRIWNKLKEADRIRAFNYIITYQNTLENGIQPKYPDTYLNAQNWND